MSILQNLTTDDAIKDEVDSVGGFGAWPSAVYDCTVALAFLTVSAGKAACLNLFLKNATGQETRQQLWMTSGEAKGCKNYYERDGEKRYLPGFIHANNLCLLTVGKEISELTTEEKVVNLYSPEHKKEMPTKVEMLVDLIGKPISVGLIQQVVDKKKKDEATGAYIPTGETRTENEIDKMFRSSDNMTVTEIKAKATEASFRDKWADKNEGQIRDKSTKTAGVAGAPPAVGKAAPKTSLFA